MNIKFAFVFKKYLSLHSFCPTKHFAKWGITFEAKTKMDQFTFA